LGSLGAVLLGAGIGGTLGASLMVAGGLGMVAFIGGGATLAGGTIAAVGGTILAFPALLMAGSYFAWVTVIALTIISIPTVLTLFIVFTTHSAFHTSISKPTALISSQVDSPYIEVVKTANTGNMENNELPKNITYTISVTAIDKALVSISATDKITAFSENNVAIPDPPGQNQTFTRDRIEIGETWTINFDIEASTSFEDTFLSNTVTVNATIEEGEAQTEVATYSIKLIVLR
jgi:hypothetical protein